MSVRAVLTFHAIDAGPPPLSVAPAVFARLVDALQSSGLPVLDLHSLLSDRSRGGIALTFDDGMESVASAAMPVLRARRLPAHLFLCTAAADGGEAHLGRTPRPMLGWNDVRALHDAGILIESHSHRHRDLRSLTDEEIAADCRVADELIERHVGRRPRYFAYPFGYHDARVRRCIGKLYAAAFTTRLAPLRAGDGVAELPRLDAHYLRLPFVAEHLDSRFVLGYLAARRMLRRMRGTE